MGGIARVHVSKSSILVNFVDLGFYFGRDDFSGRMDNNSFDVVDDR